MQAIRNKLRSRRGASLTFALLLFLVCAVVGSVVLTAGTAASGRMSQIAEMDQRYYSVNSAARLLINTINGEEVTIVETKAANGSPTYKDGSGNAIDESTAFDSIAKEAAVFYIKNTNPISRTGENALPLNLSVTGNDILTVTVKEEIQGTLRDSSGNYQNEKGTLVLTLEQGDSTQDKKSYAMKLYFNADEKHIEELTKDAQQHVIKTETTFKITWSFRDVEVVGASRREK